MIRKLFKLLLPSEKRLAEYAAQSIQQAVNGSGKEEIIAKYGAMADSATEIQKWITGMVKDGKIDEAEKKEIAEKLVPLVGYLVGLI